MKKLILAASACLIMAACNNNKGDEKKVMDDILKTHEKVMADDDHAVNNKMLIDSLLKTYKFPAQDSANKAQLATLSSNLGKADDAMSEWMHKFDPEYKGTSHTDVMNYLTSQRAQINKIDSSLSTAISNSDKALAKYKK